MIARRSPRVVPFAAGFVAAVAAGFLGYLIGHGNHQTVTTRTGVAYASPYQAAVQTGGWTYDIPLRVRWFASQGSMQYGSRPSCLPAYRRSWIVFGTVDVSAIGQRAVVWVRCS